jgi:hypothetical protein
LPPTFTYASGPYLEPASVSAAKSKSAKLEFLAQIRRLHG